MDLTVTTVPIDTIDVHPQNPRKGNVEEIANSLAVHGQYQPLVVQKSTGHVLAGNHRLLAARALGWDEVKVIYIDVDDQEATRVLLVDNRSSDLGTYDNDALVELLESLPDLTGTGYNTDDLIVMAAELELPEIIPAERHEASGEKIVADTIEWGYIGWGKTTKVRITAAEVAGMSAFLEHHKAETGTDAGLVHALLELARAGGYGDPE